MVWLVVDRIGMVVNMERMTEPDAPLRFSRRWLSLYVLLTLGLAVASIVVADRLWTAPLSGNLIFGLALAVISIGVTAAPVHLVVGREAHTIMLSELPIVVAVLTMRTSYAVLVLIPAVVIVRSIYKRIALIKTIMNSSVLAVEIATVALVGQLIAPGAQLSDTRMWVAMIFGALLSNLLSSAMVSVAIALSGGHITRSNYIRNTTIGAIGGITMASVALIGAALAIVNPASIIFTGSISIAVYVAHRRHIMLMQRHEAMQRLERFTRNLAPDRSVPVIMEKVLHHAADLLNTEHVSITLANSTGDIVLQRSLLATSPVIGPQHDLWIRAHSSPGTFSLSAADRSLSGRDRRLLAWLGTDDLIVAPLILEDDHIGVLIGADRRSVANKTTGSDLDLVTTMANHASVILERSRLIERLEQEVTEREYEATHDSLTGMHNRAAFNRFADAALLANDPHAAVMLIDLNEFKKINDTMGHHAGDGVLVQIASRLSAAIPSRATVARLGGDEFAVYVPDVHTAAEAEQIAAHLRDAINVPVTVETVTIALDAAIGISLAPFDGIDRHTLLKRADIAMYAAKERRAYPIAMYEASQQRWTARELGLIEDLRHAIDNHELWIAYQPKTSLEDGHVVGVESLCRWTHPAHGPIRPDEFIRLAEQAGLIDAITDFVITTSLRQCREWMHEGLQLSVAVNLPASNLSDPTLPSRMIAYAREHDVPPSLLTLEVTEGELMADAKTSRNVMEKLREAGFRVSIDDFGTGYSSLAYLHKLPVDELKIDRAFVQNIGVDQTSIKIVHIIVELARTFGLSTVAEGIETDEIFQTLRGLGVELGQGFLMSKPAPAHELHDILRNGYRSPSSLILAHA
jgi:diguanylate cyclase (GGDEF)-like protein